MQAKNDLLAFGDMEPKIRQAMLNLCLTVYIPQCTKYWLKILSMSEDRYPKQYYQLLYRLNEAVRKTWTSNVRLLLFQ